LLVDLKEPNVAVMYDKDHKTKFGTWTMVYDQGIILTFKDERYVTNFKYTKLPDQDASTYKDI